MELSKAVASRIKELLKQKNITQYKLFKITGVPQSTISNIMSAKSKTCKLNTLLLLIQGLGISAAEFFDCEEFNFDSLIID